MVRVPLGESSSLAMSCACHMLPNNCGQTCALSMSTAYKAQVSGDYSILLVLLPHTASRDGQAMAASAEFDLETSHFYEVDRV